MTEALNTSELGTKSYWDQAYAREIQNHHEDADDEGTVWFDDSDAEVKVLELLEKLAEDGHLVQHADQGKPATSFLDLGTGNGHMLFALREQGWAGNLVGVDYSQASVDLARQIADSRQVANDSAGLSFEQWDLLAEEPGEWLGKGFDIVLDKGTFDAISLSSEANAEGRRSNELYRDRLLPLVRPGGFFVITSCNWTREEVLKWFASDARLQLFDEADYPNFTFGGQKGQSVCTLAFRRGQD